MGHPRAIGEAFHITTDEVLTWNQHYEAVGRALGVPPKLVHMASDTLIALEPNLAGGLLGDKASSVVLDNAKIKEFVPTYQATMTFQEGVNQAVAWFRADSARQSIDPQSNAMYARLLAANERVFVG